MAGTEGCTLTTTTEGRARLKAGGTLFRSLAFNTIVNGIEINSKWQVEAGSPPIGSPSGWIDYNSGSPSFHTFADLVGVKLTITLGTTIEVFYATQTVDTTGSPGEWTWNENGIKELRTKINNITEGSSLISLPELDAKTVVLPSSTWDASLDDADHMSEFGNGSPVLSLSGGFGPPHETNLLKNIRTGPALTLIFITESEDIAGVVITPDETRYWNGACWKSHNPTIPDCAGSPPDCGSDPLVPNC